MDKLHEQKERAREIIVRLSNLDNAKRPGGGVHGQVIGMEPYMIRTTGEGLQCLSDAQSLLDELLDPFGRRAPVASAPALEEIISIRKHSDFVEDVERLSEQGLSKKQARIIRKEIYDTIDARVKNYRDRAIARITGEGE